MSRHSKNNTAHSIFTQGEKQMLQSDKWGTNRQRIGKESFKTFSSCSICLKPVHIGTCCSRGHLFCKECILSHIIQQKSDYRSQLKAYTQQLHSEEQKLNKASQEKLAKGLETLEKQEKSSLGQEEFEKFDEERRYKYMNEEKSIQLKAKDFLQSKNKPELSRAEMLQKNYWIPDTTPDETKPVLSKPSKAVLCPEGKHKVRVKDLVEIKSTLAQGNMNRFLCEGCKEDIELRKSCLVRCGHFLCELCLEMAQETCLCCMQGFRKKEVIRMQASGTMFSAHNKVEAQVKNPAFHC